MAINDKWRVRVCLAIEDVVVTYLTERESYHSTVT